VDIPLPEPKTTYIAQASVTISASTDIYAHIETY